MRTDPAVDAYIADSELWPDEMTSLRPILLASGLDEQIKWRKPCYSHDGSNVVIVQEMKNHLALMFFKGALLDDPEDILRDQGPNSQAAKRITFTSVDDVERLAGVLPAYLANAIDVEDAGLEIGPPPELELVSELQDALDEDPELAEAFAALTPGRQREYNLHIAGAEQSATRSARVERCTPKILEGKGMREL